MMSAESLLDETAARLKPYGLMPRGGFVFDETDIAPVLPGGVTPGSVILVGHSGSSLWSHFVKWRRSHPNEADPLDMWSKQVLNGVAADIGAMAVFPSDRPYLPFQRWAMRAEGLAASPLGLLIHPQYGLWQAFRGAMLFERPFEFPQLDAFDHPCDLCKEKPCLSACPVDAFDGINFAVTRCRDYLPAGGFTCMDEGCQARLACPIGREYTYAPDQQRFHMAAFAI